MLEAQQKDWLHQHGAEQSTEYLTVATPSIYQNRRIRCPISCSALAGHVVTAALCACFCSGSGVP